MHQATRVLGGILCGFLFLGGSCASSPEALTPPIGANLDPGNEALEGQAAERELAVALRMLKAGQYSTALPRFMHVTKKYPESQAAVEAHYHMGVAYHNIGGLRDARDNFERYLALAPSGKYARSSVEYLGQISDDAVNEPLTPDALDTQIAALESASAAAPLQLAQRLELANLYWKKGEYARSGALYEELINEYPQLEHDTTVRTRLERLPDGNFALLTPEEVVRRAEEAEPLAIFNTNAFRSGRFEGIPATSKERYYTVTGQVVNRGSETLHDVEVIVTIYGFGTMIYDTQTVRIGTLRPDEQRAFSAPFGNFDNIENVDRFECVGTFRRQ